jgi:ribonuclease HI
MDEVLSSQPAFKYFTDDSSFVQNGTRFAKYEVVTLDTVIEARLLQVRTSAEKAELITLSQALQLAAGVWVNIYMDSKCAFTTIHVHGALHKEKGLINSRRKSVKCKLLEELLLFLIYLFFSDAFWF